MSNTAFVLRWIGALLVAIVAYAAVMLAGSQLWKYLDADLEKVVRWSMVLATALAMIAAAHVVARESWKAMAWLVLVLAALAPLGILYAATSPGMRMTGLQMFGSVLVGGLLGFLLLYRSFRFDSVSDDGIPKRIKWW
jgi:hypothetical protein